MAPKLPPPASTRAVLAGPAWSERDKVAFAPALAPLAMGHAAFGEVYSSRCAGSTINIGCGIRHSGTVRRTRPGISRFRVHRCAMPRNDDDASPLHERLLDHEMAGLAVGALGKTPCLEHRPQLFEHGRAAAHHDAVGRDVERLLADVVEQLR